jgi:hypothetical protein
LRDQLTAAEAVCTRLQTTARAQKQLLSQAQLEAKEGLEEIARLVSVGERVNQELKQQQELVVELTQARCRMEAEAAAAVSLSEAVHRERLNEMQESLDAAQKREKRLVERVQGQEQLQVEEEQQQQQQQQEDDEEECKRQISATLLAQYKGKVQVLEDNVRRMEREKASRDKLHEDRQREAKLRQQHNEQQKQKHEQQQLIVKREAISCRNHTQVQIFLAGLTLVLLGSLRVRRSDFGEIAKLCWA